MSPCPSKSCLRGVIVVTRKSGKKATDKVSEEMLIRARQYAMSYILDHKKEPGCQCKPIVNLVFLHGISSNASIHVSNQIGIVDLRNILDKFNEKTDQRKIAIIILQNDGLSTNPTAFLEFFRPYSGLNLFLCVWYFQSAVEEPMANFLEAIVDLDAGQDLDTFPYKIVKMWCCIAINKAIIREAQLAEQRLGLKPRNSTVGGKYLSIDKYFLLDKTDPKTLFDEVPSKSFAEEVKLGVNYGKVRWTEKDKRASRNCAAMLVARIPKDKTGDRQVSLTIGNWKGKNLSVDVPVDNVTNKICCTEAPGCDATFDDFLGLIKHLANVIHNLSVDIRCCFICGGRNFDSGGRVDTTTYSNHLKTHFPKQDSCLGCKNLFQNYAALQRHLCSSPTCRRTQPLNVILQTAAKEKEVRGADGMFTCQECAQKFRESRQLRDHKADHSRAKEILAFAKSAGISSVEFIALEMLRSNPIQIDEREFEALCIEEAGGKARPAKKEEKDYDSSARTEPLPADSDVWEEYDQGIWDEVIKQESADTFPGLSSDAAFGESSRKPLVDDYDRDPLLDASPRDPYVGESSRNPLLTIERLRLHDRRAFASPSKRPRRSTLIHPFFIQKNAQKKR